MTHVPVLDSEMVPCSAQESESASGGPQLPTSGTTPVRERRKPTPATLPEMPAVHSSSPEILEAPATSAHPPLIRSPFPPAPRPSWGDAVAHDPITESGGRTTEISIVPMAVQKRDRALLLRMDGVHAGEVIPLNAPKITIGRHPNNLVVTDDTGTFRALQVSQNPSGTNPLMTNSNTNTTTPRPATSPSPATTGGAR